MTEREPHPVEDAAARAAGPDAADLDVEAVAARVERVRADVAALRDAVGAVFLGQREVLDLLLSCVLADGHALLEGAPGLGKTTLVKALADALGLSFQRIQFTPDLMPGDVLGTRVLEEDEEGRRRFRFEPGPVFANLVLADEVNRATPRTQSALLEAMQERQVTIFGRTRKLEAPFLVIATQNPIEMEGTYPLPEAQLDRFLCKVELGAPDEDALVRILDATTAEAAPPTFAPLGRDAVLAMRALVRGLPVSSDVVRLAARIVLRTDPARDASPEPVRRALRYGASPRGGQALVLLAKARALLRGHAWVAEDDVAAVAAPALRHRLVYGYEGEASGVHPDELVAAAVEAALAAGRRRKG